MKAQSYIKYLTSLCLFLFCCSLQAQEAIQFAADSTQSKVEWTAKKLGGEHHGEVQVESGNLVMEGARLSGSFELDMTSLFCTDSMDTQMKHYLEGHLKSADFFDIKTHPTALFEIIAADQTIDVTGRPSGYDVLGRLTLKGIGQSVAMKIKVKPILNGIRITGSCTIDRTKWDILYGSKTFFSDIGDKLIYDDIELKIDVTAYL